VKPELTSADRARATATWKNLFAAFESALRLLHPFMPFLTEELWHRMPQRVGAHSIALDRFPEPHAKPIDEDAEEQIALLQEVITAARNIRAEMKIDQKAKVPSKIAPASESVRSIIENSLDTILRLANLSAIAFVTPPFDSTKGTIRSTKDFELFIAFDAAFDVQAEVARLRKELDRLTKDVAAKQQRLEDQTFRSRAPEHIVKGLESTLAERQAEFGKLGERLAQLEKALPGSA
jgi:valyl-tRNA synthetase